jgi:hypothetical protein
MAGHHREGDSMTTRHAGGTLALLAGAALLVAACSGAASTSAPTTAPTTLPTTQPTQAAPSLEIPGSSLALPTFHSNVDLEKLIPSQIGGEAVKTQSMSGAQFLGTPNNAFAGALATLGKQPSDVSVAFGFNMQLSVIAFQIRGTQGSAILDAFKNTTQDVGTLTDASFGGKAVKRLTPSDTIEGVSYIYTTQDVVFVVSGTTTLTDALLNEAFSKLP